MISVAESGVEVFRFILGLSSGVVFLFITVLVWLFVVNYREMVCAERSDRGDGME
jgi:hypothetical protein